MGVSTRKSVNHIHYTRICDQKIKKTHKNFVLILKSCRYLKQPRNKNKKLKLQS